MDSLALCSLPVSIFLRRLTCGHNSMAVDVSPVRPLCVRMKMCVTKFTVTGGSGECRLWGPHAHVVTYGMLGDPTDAVTAQTRGAMIRFRKVIIPLTFIWMV